MLFHEKDSGSRMMDGGRRDVAAAVAVATATAVALASSFLTDRAIHREKENSLSFLL